MLTLALGSAFLAFLCLVYALTTGAMVGTVGVFVFAILGIVFLLIDVVTKRREK